MKIIKKIVVIKLVFVSSFIFSQNNELCSIKKRLDAEVVYINNLLDVLKNNTDVNKIIAPTDNLIAEIKYGDSLLYTYNIGQFSQTAKYYPDIANMSSEEIKYALKTRYSKVFPSINYTLQDREYNYRDGIFDTLVIVQKRVSSNTWRNYEKTTRKIYGYNTTTNNIDSIKSNFYTWNTTGNAWVLSNESVTYFALFNFKSKSTGYLSKSYFSNGGITYFKGHSLFDVNGDDILRIDSLQNSSNSSSYSIYSVDSNFYDGQHNMIKKQSYVSYFVNTPLQLSYGVLRTYNSSNRLLSDRQFYYSSFGTNIFVTIYGSNMLYDANQNRTQISVGRLDEPLTAQTLNNFKPNRKIDYLYLNNSIQKIRSSYWDTISNSWIPMDSSLVQYDSDNRIIKYARDQVFYYGPAILVGVENLTLSHKAALFYPNPSNNKLHIVFNKGEEFNQITITDVSGKSVLSRMILKDNNVVEINQLPKGLYTIKIGNSLPNLFLKD